MAQDSHLAHAMSTFARGTRVAILTAVLACGGRKDGAAPAGAAPKGDAASSSSAVPTVDAGSPLSKPPARTPMKQPAELATDAALSCDLKKTADGFEITYTVREASGREAYVLDIESNYKDPPIRVETPIYVAINEGGIARIVQGLVPLPAWGDVNHRSIPLGKRIAPNATLRRTLRIRTPMQEQGPYDPPEATPSTPSVKVDKLVIDVHLLRPGVKDFKVGPEQEPDDGRRVTSWNMDGDARRVSCEIAIPPTLIHEAAKLFTRIDAAAPPPAPLPPPRPPAPPPQPPTVSPAPIANGATLSCKSDAKGDDVIRGDKLTLTYTVQETAGDELYVLDLLHDETRPGNRIPGPIYLGGGADGARIVQGIAPLPIDKRKHPPRILAAWRLAPGAKTTRTITLPLPLREEGPYDGPVTPLGMGNVKHEVRRIVLDVHVVRSTVPNFSVKPSTDIEGAFTLPTAALATSVERVTCEVKVPLTWVYMHGDRFVRVR